METLGFRFGNVAYSTDLNDLPEPSFEILADLDVWIVDALRPKPHPTHSHLAQTLEWIERLRPKHAILTHMTWDMDYQTLCRELPAGVEPAYDGLVIDLP
jgi:phosphoribosyl 1,2-cyclic phosphate phosphodiesterase